MIERITDPHRPVSLRNGTGRIPDGREVPQPPRPAPAPNRYEWRVFWLTLAVVALGVLIGVLR